MAIVDQKDLHASIANEAKAVVGKDAPPKHAAGIAFRAPDGSVLLLKRAPTEPNFGGHWSLPGGNMEPGETPEQTAVREAGEEIGAVPNGARRLAHKRVTPRGLAFHAFEQPVAAKFDPKLNAEHTDHVWARPDNLPAPMHPAVKEFLQAQRGASDGEFEEAKHPRAGNGQFGSGGGAAQQAPSKSAPKTYRPGNVSFSSAAPAGADETEEHEDTEDGTTYDVSYVTDGDTIHAVVSNVEVQNEAGEPVPVDSLGRVQAYKLQKKIAAAVKGHVEDRAETETEGERWDSLSDEEQVAEIEAKERAAAEADRGKQQDVDRDIDALLTAGWQPEFNSSGGLHAGKTPDALKKYASPKSMDKIMARLRDKGFKPPVRTPAQDSIAFDKASVRRVDQDGHLHVEMTPISKANVCGYLGKEIPDFEKLGLDPDKTYKLYRDPKELAKAAPSFAGKPLLLQHKPISADDHPREITVGSIGDEVKFRAPYLMAPLHIHDGEAISLINSGAQKELSSAYRYRADMRPGKSPDGEAFDGVMRDIVANHAALVAEGRCGPGVYVMDSDPYSVQWTAIEKAILELA